METEHLIDLYHKHIIVVRHSTIIKHNTKLQTGLYKQFLSYLFQNKPIQANSCHRCYSKPNLFPPNFPFNKTLLTLRTNHFYLQI